MSGEYFCVEEINNDSKFIQECNINNRGKHAESYTSIDKLSQDVRLHEMEEQLEIAENRCNTLKDQLDHMKKLYQNKTEFTKILKPPNRLIHSACKASPKRNPVDFKSTSRGSDLRSSSSLNRSERSVIYPLRQNSQAISTDNSGAAVQTINNILTGITDSVNRLSQIHVHIDERPSSKKMGRLRDSACGDDIPIVNLNFTPRTDEPRDTVSIEEDAIRSNTTADVCRQSSTIISIKSKVANKKRSRRRNRNVLRNSTIMVNISNKKSLKSTAKHVEKKFKIEPVKMMNKDSSSILSPKKSKKQIAKLRHKSGVSLERHKNMAKQLGTEPEKLVEIYHNNAAKGSETDLSTHDIRKSVSTEIKRQKSSSETVPSLPLDEISDSSVNKQQQPPPPQQQLQQLHQQQQQQQQQPRPQNDSLYCTYNNNNRLSPIEENVYMEPTAPRTENCYSMCSKNYELPTIASKMKQVAKSYLRRFNFHSIPFCAAKSTSPSHNIGINIQQVMSIIKTRQPVTGISPTLAHNIGLAAEKLQGTPFTAMVSSLGSRIGYKRSMCPLMRPNLNYQQLQEMAKEIPEEGCEDEATKQIAEEEMGCGDRNATTWTVDPSTQKNCTCVSQQGVGFQQVLSRYNGNTYSASTFSQLQYRTRPRQSKFFATPVKIRTKTISVAKPPTANKPLEYKVSGPLKGKERNLKEVLTNLHNEFAYLNQQYESFSKKVEELGADADETTLKQLQQMEMCLSNKEEEITMVMTLYKEVMLLKQQVKTLKERASMASLSLNAQLQFPQQIPMPQYRNFNDTHTAVHLTKLLRQIQTYQEMNRIGRRN